MRNVHYDIRVHLKRSKRFSMEYDIILSPICPPPDETSYWLASRNIQVRYMVYWEAEIITVFRGISMEEKTANASVQAQQPAPDTTPAEQSTGVGSAAPLAEKNAPASEARQALGTAKTENLRDSGVWRILLPVVVVLFCLALLAIPLMFLVPLLFESFNPAGPTGASGAQLTWVWIVMIVLEVAIAAMIIRGLIRVFMTQAGNYHS
jgi:hypothetical protein